MYLSLNYYLLTITISDSKRNDRITCMSFSKTALVKAGFKLTGVSSLTLDLLNTESKGILQNLKSIHVFGGIRWLVFL